MKTSTIALLLILSLSLETLQSQTIPNNSFEAWSRDTVDLFGTPIMFDHPVGWAPLASLFNAMFGLGEIGLYQSTEHHGSGTFSALFEAGPSSVGADMFSVFPVNAVVPPTLQAYYKYEGNIGEPASVNVLFTKYDAGADSSIIVAQGEAVLTNFNTSWTQFSVNISPVQALAPDTAYILVTYFDNAAPPSPQKSITRFWIDNLSFGGTSHIAKEALPEIRLMQDPAATMVSLEWKAEPGVNYTVEIYSLTGRLIDSQDRVSGRATFNLASLPRGLYIIRLTDGKQVHARKFVH